MNSFLSEVLFVWFQLHFNNLIRKVTTQLISYLKIVLGHFFQNGDQLKLVQTIDK